MVEDADSPDRQAWSGIPRAFVGRTRQLRALEALWPDASPMAVATMEGPLGIGKTRLLLEFGRRVAGRGVSVLLGRPVESEPGLWLTALSAESATFPWPARRRTGGRPAEPDRWRRVRARLAGLAAGRGLLLLVDDLQWADEASLDLLTLLLRDPPGTGPTVVVLAHRTAGCPPRVARVLAALPGHRAQHVRLPALSDGDVDVLLAGEPSHRRDLLRRAGGGNPSYLDLLGRLSVADLGALSRDRPVTDEAVRRLDRSPLAAELAALPADWRTVLAAAAVTGTRFEAPVVARLVADDPVDVHGILDRLVDRGVLSVVDGQLGFHHPLVHAIAYRLRGPAWRGRMHARMAAWLTAAGASPLRCGPHLEHCLAPTAAAEARRLVAGARLLLDDEPEVGARWARAALRVLERTSAPPAELDDVRLVVGVALSCAGRLRSALAVLDPLAAHDTESADDAAAWAARCARMLNRPVLARRLLVGRHERRADGDPATSGLLELETALLEWTQGRPEAAARRVGRVARRAGTEHALAAAAWAAVGALGHRPAHLVVGELTAVYERATDLHDDQLLRLGSVLPAVGWAGWAVQQHEPVLRQMGRVVDVAERRGHVLVLPHAWCVRAAVLTAVGRLAEAVRATQRAEELARSCGADEALYLAVLLRLRPVLCRDGPRAVAPLLDRLDTISCPRHAWWWPAAATILADVRHRSGRAPRPDYPAAVRGSGGAGVLGPLSADDLAVDVDVALALGDVDRAERAARRALDEAARHRLPGPLGAARMASARVCATRGEHAQAAGYAAQAAGSLRVAGLPVAEAQAQLLRAESDLAAGRHEAAEPAVSRACRLLRDAGADWLLDGSARLGRQVVARRPRRRRAGQQPAALTPRERQIANLAAEGLTSRAIAHRLYLSPRTVETHLTRVFGKLGVRSRAAMARQLSRIG